MTRPQILIVEDEAIIASNLQNTLERLGYDVPALAFSGEEAIAQTAATHPDLVLMDIKLQGKVDGIEAAEEIRTRFDIPIVYLTGYADDVTLQRAKLTEPFGYLLKPFETSDLHSTVETALYRHSMEKKLRESEARYRAVAETMFDYAFALDVDDQRRAVVAWATDTLRQATGYELDELLAQGGLPYLVHPDDRSAAWQQRENLLSGKSHVGEYRIVTKGGAVRWVRSYGRPEWDREHRRVVRVYVAAQDISAQKRTQERLNALLFLSQEAYRMNEKQIIQFGLEEAVRLTESAIGYLHFVSPDERSIQLVAWSESTLAQCTATYDTHYPLDAAGIWAACVRVRNPVVHNDYQSIPGRRGYPEGHAHLTRHMSVPIFEGDSVRVILGVGNKVLPYDESDVQQVQLIGEYLWTTVQRMRAEHALRESEHTFRSITEHSNDAIVLTDEQGAIIEWNRAAERLIGLGREEVIGRLLWDVQAQVAPGEPRPQEVSAQIEAMYRELYRTGQASWLGQLAEEEVQRPDGTRRTFQVSNFVFPTGHGHRVGAVMRDVSEHRQTQEALRQANLVVENSPVVLFRWKAAEGWPVELVSNNVIQFGYLPEEFLSGAVPYASIVHPDDLERVAREVQEHAASGVESFQQEYRIVTKDGRARWLDDRTVIERDAAGRITHYQGIVIDITERVRMEEQLRAALQEKMVLLREIHHRVKNNLQIVSSLLYLQADSVQDEQISGMLLESRHRIRSMVLVHEMLYGTQDLTMVGFDQYLERLTSYLLRALCGNTDRIRLDTEAANVNLPIDTATPCALIINELVSNSLKHAFPHDQAGEIHIRVAADQGRIRLTVADTGVGFPPELDFRATASLGLKLVTMLVEQLDGTIELDRSRGTSFTVEFVEPKYKERI